MRCNPHSTFLIALVTSLIAACSMDPAINTVAGSEQALARQLLKEQPSLPVILVGEFQDLTGLSTPTIASAVDDGVAGIEIKPEILSQQPLDTDPRGSGLRLLLGPGDRPLTGVCLQNAAAPSKTSFVSALCRDGELVSATTIDGITDWTSSPERLIWRSLRVLTKDDYASRYGVNIFGGNVGVDVGVGMGF